MYELALNQPRFHKRHRARAGSRSALRADVRHVAELITQEVEGLVEAASFGWLHHRGGAIACHSTAPDAFANSVVVTRSETRVADVGALLDELAATGGPYCLRIRPGMDPEIDALATERGMRPHPRQPLLLATSLVAAGDPRPEGLLIEEVTSGDAELYAQLLAEGFETRPEIFRVLCHSSVLKARGLRCYIAYLHGAPVATGAGHTVGDGVMLMNISTLPAHRRHGYGRAITTRAISDGFAAGAAWAFLFASPAGLPLYQQIGFSELEAWTVWTSE